MEEKDVKILFTGGHAATTALSVIQKIKEKYPGWNLYWVGPESNVEGKKIPTLASTVMPKIGVRYIPITAGRVQRKFTVWTIPSLLKIPVGFLDSFKIILDIKPRLIVSFGGYAAVPICFMAWMMRIPVIIHEQTVAVGRANKVTAFFARKILIAREESKEYFPQDKIVLTGNPVSEGICEVPLKSKISSPPVIYITGGSSGAQRINAVVGESLFDLLKKYKVIHQTGRLDYEDFKNKREEFPTDLKKRYEVYDFIDPSDVPAIFREADVVVSRAGANTVSEIIVTRRPSVLIPIPWTAYDEQTKNARLAQKIGIATLLLESEMNKKNILEKIEFTFKNWKRMINEMDTRLADLDKMASSKVLTEIESLL